MITGEQGAMRERPLVGQRDFQIDLVKLFTYSRDGEFLKGVHRCLTVRAGGGASVRTVPSVFP